MEKRHLEKEERYMETLKAVVEEIDEKYFIKIKGDLRVSIPISEDDPNMVKSAFNKLILRLKKGNFQIELGNIDVSLAHQVAKEYIRQLNREISEVYDEMEELDLLNLSDM